MQRREYRFNTSGLSLQVTEWGDEHARPVVMLHGIRGFGETFAGVAQALQPEFRVIALDQRGRGQSDWTPSATTTPTPTWPTWQRWWTRWR